MQRVCLSPTCTQEGLPGAGSRGGGGALTGAACLGTGAGDRMNLLVSLAHLMPLALGQPAACSVNSLCAVNISWRLRNMSAEGREQLSQREGIGQFTSPKEVAKREGLCLSDLLDRPGTDSLGK